MTRKQPETTVALLTKTDARKLTNRIKGKLDELWPLIAEAKEREAWKALGYKNWTAYVTEEFAISRSRSYQLIDQGKVIRAIGEAAGKSVHNVDTLTEAQVRAVKPRLTEVTGDIKSRVAKGQDPKTATREAVETVRKPLTVQPNMPRTDRDEGNPRRAQPMPVEKPVPAPDPHAIDPVERAMSSSPMAAVECIIAQLQNPIFRSDDGILALAHLMRWCAEQVAPMDKAPIDHQEPFGESEQLPDEPPTRLKTALATPPQRTYQHELHRIPKFKAAFEAGGALHPDGSGGYVMRMPDPASPLNGLTCSGRARSAMNVELCLDEVDDDVFAMPAEGWA